jgi:hypothetical protein
MPNVLTNKQYRDYQKVSRYASVPYYYNTNDRRFFYGSSPRLKSDIPHRIHKVMEEDTLDTLALYYYNNPTYFWIIADFNNIRDPFEPLEVGSHLKIPSFSSLEFED